MKSRLYFFIVLTVANLIVPCSQAQDPEFYELPPINYSDAKPEEVVTRLEAGIITGKVKLAGTDRQVVQTLLRLLHVPIASQLLVFSKTSFQKDIISPDHPRALYYTDNCYVGWVPGGLVEVVAIDPKLGPIFYSFDPRGLSAEKKPEFSRESFCLRCHGGNFIEGIPAVFARSLFADKEGEPIFRQGSEVVDYRTLFSERWGGWYVTGQHGSTVHRGNVYASEDGDQLVFNPALGANVTNLSRYFDTSDYLTNTSDIVSLLVFEHQLAMQNALTRAGINCRHMLDYQKRLQVDLKEPAPSDIEPSFDSVRKVFDHSADDVVDTLLFKDEAVMPKTLIGSVAFQKVFTGNAPRAPDGSSLKDLLLSEHLFKNRCGYLIYSDSFLSLPPPLKHRIYARLDHALDSKHPNPRYSYIGDAERQRINFILRATHPEFRKAQDAKQ
ncbi:MAG TPA: hypothetical protein VFC44_01025 [Candidatus Saccharimonadales bacterium]|nr:hypothetical protein [Candidatus Saccharimonadales bacterium]